MIKRIIKNILLIFSTVPIYLGSPTVERTGHIKPRDFQLIGLTSFILKTLERLVARLIKNIIVMKRFLSNAQYSYMEDQPMETALHHLVPNVE